MYASGDSKLTRRAHRPSPLVAALFHRPWMSATSLTIFALAALTGTGCARVHMSVNAYRSTSLPFPEPGADTTIAVIAQTMPAEPLLTEEIKGKATAILKARGFALATEDKADYLLLCVASMDSGITDTEYAPVTSPGRYAYSHVRGRRGRGATVTTYIPGRTTYVPYSYTVYTKGLVLTCLKKDLVRDRADDEKGEANENATAWRCVTLSTGSESDLRWIVNHMLLTAFDRFGTDTGHEKQVSMDLNDERVLRLAEDGAYEPSE